MSNIKDDIYEIIVSSTDDESAAEKIADSLTLDTTKIMEIVDRYYDKGIGTMWTSAEIEEIEKEIDKQRGDIIQIKAGD